MKKFTFYSSRRKRIAKMVAIRERARERQRVRER